jgi:hypothetical protein
LERLATTRLSTALLKLFFWISDKTYGFSNSTISCFITPIVWLDASLNPGSSLIAFRRAWHLM